MSASDASPTVLISKESLDERINWRWSERDLDAEAAEEQAEWGCEPERLNARASDEHDEIQGLAPGPPLERRPLDYQAPHLDRALGFHPFGMPAGDARHSSGHFDLLSAPTDQLPTGHAVHWPTFGTPTVTPSSLHAPPNLSSLGLSWAGGGSDRLRGRPPSAQPLSFAPTFPPAYWPMPGDWSVAPDYDPICFFGPPAFQPGFGRPLSAYYPPPPPPPPLGQSIAGMGNPLGRPGCGGETFGSPRPPRPLGPPSAPYFQPPFFPTPHATFDMLPPPPLLYGDPMAFRPPPSLPSPTSPFMPYPDPAYYLPRPPQNLAPTRPRPPPSPLDLRAARLPPIPLGAQQPANHDWPSPSQRLPETASHGDSFQLQPSFGRSIYTLAADIRPSSGPAASPPAPTPSPSEPLQRDSDEWASRPHGLTPPSTRLGNRGTSPKEVGQGRLNRSAGVAPVPIESRSQHRPNPTSPDKTSALDPAVSLSAIEAAGSLPADRVVQSLRERAEAIAQPLLRSSRGVYDQLLLASSPVGGQASSSAAGKRPIGSSVRGPGPSAKKRKTAAGSSAKPRRRRRSQCKNACSRCQRLHKPCDSDGSRPCAKCVKNLGLERAQLECEDSPRIDVGRRRSLQGPSGLTSDDAAKDDASGSDNSSSLSSLESSPSITRASTPTRPSTPSPPVGTGQSLRPRIESPTRSFTAALAPTHAYKTRANTGLPM